MLPSRPGFPCRTPLPEPTTSEPTTNDPTMNEAATSEPTINEPTTNEPTTSEPTTNEPTTSEPTTSEPTTNVNKPSTNEPTTTGEPSQETTRSPSVQKFHTYCNFFYYKNDMKIKNSSLVSSATWVYVWSGKAVHRYSIKTYAIRRQNF